MARYLARYDERGEFVTAMSFDDAAYEWADVLGLKSVARILEEDVLAFEQNSITEEFSGHNTREITARDMLELSYKQRKLLQEKRKQAEVTRAKIVFDAFVPIIQKHASMDEIDPIGDQIKKSKLYKLTNIREIKDIIKETVADPRNRLALIGLYTNSTEAKVLNAAFDDAEEIY